mmetsp:Transcript_17418/g.47328  ORF Transcript_17418/g.47328 Transcript_17418/m.47328 type:complete len:206 (-) Transcript_17418:163-780(-)
MPTEELCGTMQHNVNTPLKGSAKVRGSRGVVADQRQPVLVRNGCQLLQVNDHTPRVADGLTVDGLCLVINLAFHALVVVHVDKTAFPAKLCKLPRELRHGSTIQLVSRDEVVAREHQVGEAYELGGMPRGDAQRLAAALECCNLGFQGVASGVADARVDGAEGLQPKLLCRVLGVSEDKACALHNGRHTSARDRVWLLTRVEAHG